MRKNHILRFLFLFLVASAAIGQGTVKFLTINVWSGLTYQGTFKTQAFESGEQRAFRYGLLVNELREIDADVIALNEANMLPGYAKRIARDLGYDYIYAVARGGVRLGQVGFPFNLREGEVILAKRYLNLTQLGSKGLQGGYAGNFASFHLHDATQALAGRITVGEREVVVFNTMWHDALSPNRLGELVALYDLGEIEGKGLLDRMRVSVEGKSIRMEEAEKTLLFVEELVGGSGARAPGAAATGAAAPGAATSDAVDAGATGEVHTGQSGAAVAVVLMGDLNAPPSSEEIALLKASGLLDSWDDSAAPGYTWDEFTNTNIIKYHGDIGESRPLHRERMSYVFYRGVDINVVSSDLALDGSIYDIHPSDHYGVLVELEF